jgi:hypothetical protein
MGLNKVGICRTYAAYMLNICQETLHPHRAVVAGQQIKIFINEVQDHITMPEYPHTSSSGILHFIHSKNPITNLEPTTKELSEAFTREISQVSILLTYFPAYAKHMPNIGSVWPTPYKCC